MPQDWWQKPRGVTALLLDFDGTLADSLGVMEDVYREFLLAVGRTPCKAEFNSLNGPPLSEVVRRLKSAHGLPHADDELLAQYERLLDAIYQGVRPSTGAQDLLTHARTLGCRTAVVTSNSRKRVANWLDTQELFQYIDELVTSEDVTAGKPDPAPYLLALQRTSTKPADAIAVEDSFQGAEAALKAGVRTFLLRRTEIGSPCPDGVIVITGLSDVCAHLTR